MLKFTSISAKNEIIKRNYEKKITIHNFFFGVGLGGGIHKARSSNKYYFPSESDKLRFIQILINNLLGLTCLCTFLWLLPLICKK